MKFIIIPYIALGLVLSQAIGIKYNCLRPEIFATYYGSPFIFKEKSMGSSMTYFYSISGLIVNISTWSVFLYLVNKGIEHFRSVTKIPAVFNNAFKFAVGFMVVLTTFNLAFDILMLGNGFEKN